MSAAGANLYNWKMTRLSNIPDGASNNEKENKANEGHPVEC